MFGNNVDVDSTVGAGICTGCGTCSGLCPRDAVRMNLNSATGLYFPGIDKEKCNKCGICISVCPGHDVDFNQFARNIFGENMANVILGHYLNIYIGYSYDPDIRYSSASGGLVTSLLIFALEGKLIDGALVTKMRADRPLEPQSFIARTREDLISAARSKYCPVPANVALNEILKAEGRFAVVGLPCHMHGIIKAEASSPKLNGKIAFHLGLMCSHSNSFLMTDFILKWLKLGREEVRKIDYRGQGWPGVMSIRASNGTQTSIPFEKYSILHELDLFAPLRCLMCCDTVNRLADISFGDAWMLGIQDSIGTSIAISRTARGENLLKLAAQKNVLALSQLSDDQIKQWCPSSFRLRRAAGFMSLRRVSRRKVPHYNLRLPAPGLIGYIGAIASFLAGRLGAQPWLWHVIIAILPTLQSLLKRSKTVLSRILSWQDRRIKHPPDRTKSIEC